MEGIKYRYTGNTRIKVPCLDKVLGLHIALRKVSESVTVSGNRRHTLPIRLLSVIDSKKYTLKKKMKDIHIKLSSKHFMA